MEQSNGSHVSRWKPCESCGSKCMSMAVFCEKCGKTFATLPQGPGVVDATAFVLRDEDGRPRATLALDAGDNEPKLTFIGANGVAGVSVGFLLGGLEQGMHVYDGFGEPYFRLFVPEDGLPGLDIYHMQGFPRLSLGMHTDGRPVIEMSDADRKSHVELGYTRDDLPVLSIRNANGERVSITPAQDSLD